MRLQSLLLLAAVVSSGCAGHRISHSAPDESVPHVSWEIRAGGDEGDERSVCESSETPRNCVLHSTTAQRPSRVTVHLYLHPAASTVNYVGVMRTPFMQGGMPPELSLAVSPGSRPVGRTISGVATNKPGDYELSIALDALIGNARAPVQILERVPVTVK